MGQFESSIEKTDWFPRCWYRYVDDVFAIVKKGTEQQILAFLNSQNDAIKFTMEVEIDNKISFLDLMLERNDNKIEIDIFIPRKIKQQF